MTDELKIISRFQNEYRFLSNFYPCEVFFRQRTFQSAEAAYQSAKTLDLDEILAIQFAETPGKAKQLGRQVKNLVQGWEKNKIQIMETILEIKFSDPSLSEKLISTHPKQLVEGNSWGDTFWGVDAATGLGQNRLGRILMQERDRLLRLQSQHRNYSTF